MFYRLILEGSSILYDWSHPGGNGLLKSDMDYTVVLIDATKGLRACSKKKSKE